MVDERVLWRNVLERQGVGIAHASEEDRLARLERAEGRLGLVVPLAGEERRIAGLGESLGPGGLALEVVLDVEERPAGQEHGPRRHANRPLHRAHAVGPGERRALSHQPVEVRRADMRVAQGRDRVGPLVVAEEDQDVRPGGLGTGRRGAAPQTVKAKTDSMTDAARPRELQSDRPCRRRAIMIRGLTHGKHGPKRCRTRLIFARALARSNRLAPGSWASVRSVA